MAEYYTVRDVIRALEKQVSVAFGTEATDIERFRCAYELISQPVPIVRVRSPYVLAAIGVKFLGETRRQGLASTRRFVGDYDPFDTAAAKRNAEVQRIVFDIADRFRLVQMPNGKWIDNKGRTLEFNNAIATYLRHNRVGDVTRIDFAGDPVVINAAIEFANRATAIEVLMARKLPSVTMLQERKLLLGGFSSVTWVSVPEALKELANAAGYWLPLTHCVLVSDRPKKISLDERFRLHDMNAPALVYHDEWSISAINGVVVPEYFVNTSADSISPSEVMAEGNIEVRAALMKKVGLVRFMHILKPITISFGPDKRSRLVEFEINGVRCRGLHVYWKELDGEHQTLIPVPRERSQFGRYAPDNINDFEQVRMWTFGLDPKKIEIIAES